MRKTQREREGGRKEDREVETEKKARVRQKQQQKKHTLWQGQIFLRPSHTTQCLLPNQGLPL